MSTGTVSVRLMGGLGNQLFQYAAARALAQRHGAPVTLDISSYARQKLRRYELSAYALPAGVLDNTAPGLSSAMKKVLRLFGLQQNADSTGAPVYREPHFHYDNSIRQQIPPVCLEGYWQSEKYFSDIADTLRRELTPQQALTGENLTIAKSIENTSAVSLHVRRGDYVTNAQTNAYHGTCSLDYYRDAAAHIAQRIKDPHYYIFSDDPAWTKENLSLDHPTTFVTANLSDKGFFDLELMRRCKHHIIANSSFSWWGAWLNGRQNKIVVSPKNWFAANEHDTRDLLPDSWVRL